MNPLELAEQGPVIPVIVLQRVEDAVPMAQALVAGGVRVLEITMPIARRAANLCSSSNITNSVDIPPSKIKIITIIIFFNSSIHKKSKIIKKMHEKYKITINCIGIKSTFVMQL